MSNPRRPFESMSSVFLRICSRCPGVDGFLAYHKGGAVESSGVKTGQEGLVPGRDGQSPSLRRETYKEVLLRTEEKQTSIRASSQVRSVWERKGRRFSNLKRVVRCFRCLAIGHLAVDCRDPVKCRACRRLGHKVYQCKKKAAKAVKGADGVSMNLNRAHRQRERIPRLKAFVPFTEEYLRRVELRRNALLADVVQPGDFGLAPQ